MWVSSAELGQGQQTHTGFYGAWNNRNWTVTLRQTWKLAWAAYKWLILYCAYTVCGFYRTCLIFVLRFFSFKSVCEQVPSEYWLWVSLWGKSYYSGFALFFISYCFWLIAQRFTLPLKLLYQYVCKLSTSTEHVLQKLDLLHFPVAHVSFLGSSSAAIINVALLYVAEKQRMHCKN